jgi:ketosteroid isomerase-like protein
MRENEEVVRTWYQAFHDRDMDTVMALLADDAIMHVPGHNQFSGDWQGKAALRDLWDRIKAFTDGTFRVKHHDIASSDNHVFVLVGAWAERDGQAIEERDVEVHRVEDGRIKEIWLYIDDVYRGDVFWNP